MTRFRDIETTINNIFVTKIIPIWYRERPKFKSFLEWEEFCIAFDSLKFIPEAYHKIILNEFGRVQNLNYYYFWKMKR